MKTYVPFCILFLFLILLSCDEFTTISAQKILVSETEKIYDSNSDSLKNSISKGVPGNGSLVNGKTFPYTGNNFHYFSKESYVKERAFLNHRVKALVLESYQDLQEQSPEQKFGIMECSKKNGGKISGHRTHQNGLSIDFMSQKNRNNQSYYGLDHIGAKHYLLAFNNQGELISDTSVKIDFEMMGQHILALHKKAKKHHLKVKKVILKKELKDDLYKNSSGTEIKKKEIYITMNLPSKINEAHDDHYHIDFEVIN